MYAAVQLIVGLSVILSGVVFTDDQNKRRGERNTTVFTREGENATLPCHLDPSNLKSPAFDWKKGSQEVFMYQHGKPDYTNGLKGQDPKFKGRVRLVPGGLQAEKASVILSNVSEEDIGVYKCVLLHKELTSWIDLKMVVDPELTLTIEEDRLSCVSKGGLPKPRGLVLQYQDGAEVGATYSTDGSDRDSLRLNQRVTKPGNYSCLALQGDVNPARVTRQYFVVDPELTLTIEEDRLSCVSKGGLPKPRGLVLQYQDGAEVCATYSTDGSDRDSLRLNQRVTKSGNYTCLALQGDVNPARVTRQYFGNRKSSTITWIICVIYVVAAIIIVVYINLFGS